MQVVPQEKAAHPGLHKRYSFHYWNKFILIHWRYLRTTVFYLYTREIFESYLSLTSSSSLKKSNQMATTFAPIKSTHWAHDLLSRCLFLSDTDPATSKLHITLIVLMTYSKSLPLDLQRLFPGTWVSHPLYHVVTRVTESVNHDHEQCCRVRCTALPNQTLGLGTYSIQNKYVRTRRKGGDWYRSVYFFNLYSSL